MARLYDRQILCPKTSIDLFLFFCAFCRLSLAFKALLGLSSHPHMFNEGGSSDFLGPNPGLLNSFSNLVRIMEKKIAHQTQITPPTCSWCTRDTFLAPPPSCGLQWRPSPSHCQPHSWRPLSARSSLAANQVSFHVKALFQGCGRGGGNTTHEFWGARTCGNILQVLAPQTPTLMFPRTLGRHLQRIAFFIFKV